MRQNPNNILNVETPWDNPNTQDASSGFIKHLYLEKDEKWQTKQTQTHQGKGMGV